MEELKRCPFCGGEAEVLMKRESEIGWTIWCQCGICYARTEGYCPDLKKYQTALNEIEQCKNLAIKKWNSRVKE